VVAMVVVVLSSGVDVSSWTVCSPLQVIVGCKNVMWNRKMIQKWIKSGKSWNNISRSKEALVCLSSKKRTCSCWEPGKWDSGE
jgi:hypothetical protein